MLLGKDANMGDNWSSDRNDKDGDDEEEIAISSSTNSVSSRSGLSLGTIEPVSSQNR